MGNSQTQAQSDGPRILWPTKPFTVTAKEFSSKWKQEILLAPPSEWFFRGSLKKLCLHNIARNLIFSLLDNPPKEVNKEIQKEFLKLSPDLRQELWDHASKWLLGQPNAPTPPGKRPIMWDYEAEKYYDKDKQDLWGQMARLFFIHIGGIDEFVSTMYGYLQPSPSSRYFLPMDKKLLKKVTKWNFSTYETDPNALNMAIKEFEYAAASKRLADVALAANYDARMGPFATEFIRISCSQCQNLTRLKLVGLPITQESIDFLAENITDSLEELHLSNLTFEPGVTADSALLKLAKRLTKLVDLNIATVRIENAKRTGKMFKYLTNLQKIKMGEHQYYAQEPQRDWEEIWDDMRNEAVPANAEAQQKKTEFLERAKTRKTEGSAALMKSLCKYFGASNQLLAFAWPHSDLAGEESIEYLSRFLASTTKLQSLDISNVTEEADVGKLFKQVSELPHLEALEISQWRANLPLESALCLTDAKNFPSLTELNLGIIKGLNDTELLKLIPHWPVRLSKLRFSAAAVTDASVIEFLKLATNLEELELSYCEEITDAVVDVIVENCTKLKDLKLGGKNLKGSSLHKLTALVSLTGLDIAYWPKVSSKDIFDLLIRLPNITYLSFPTTGRPVGKATPKWDVALKTYPGVSMCRNVFY